jgi:hypothetical protein
MAERIFARNSASVAARYWSYTRADLLGVVAESATGRKELKVLNPHLEAACRNTQRLDKRRY